MTATDPQLPPGQSTRNHADRLAVRGAAGTAVETLRPHPTDVLDDAVADSRPLFPWRPVALVLATSETEDGWASAVALVDALHEVDVDARLALPSAPVAPPRSVQPALASETTLRHLHPDAVIAWDPDAVASAEAWATGLRSLVVVERDPDATGVATVPWRIGVARGRVRGRFGPDASPSDLASLLRRLAAGPQPEAPDPGVVVGLPNRRWDLVDPTLGVHRHPRPRTCTFVLGTVAGDGRRAAESLAGHLPRAGVSVELAHMPGFPLEAASSDLVLLQGVAHLPTARDLVARRAGRPTIFVLDEVDVDADGSVGGAARELLHLCGRGIAPTPTGAELLRAAAGDEPVRVVTIPHLLAADRYRLLARAARRAARSVTAIAWMPASDPADAADDAVEAALVELLAERPNVRIDVVRGSGRLRGHESVRRIRNDPRPQAAARWSLLIASGRADPPLHRPPQLLAEAGVLGVPVLVAPGGWAAHPGRAVVHGRDAGAWVRSITDVVDDPLAHEQLAVAAATAAAALHSTAAADAVVNRLLGWIDGAGAAR